MASERLLTLEGSDKVTPTNDGTGLVPEYALNILRNLLPIRPMLRIPMFTEVDPAVYLPKLAPLKKAGYDLMLEPCDSAQMARLSIVEYELRFEACVKVLRELNPVIECGNEVSGARDDDAWPGPDAAEKTRSVLSYSRSHQLRTAVTYYLSADDEKWLWEWVKAHPLRSSYALISFYPNTTPKKKVTAAVLSTLIKKLGGDAPAAFVGLGEYGAQNAQGNVKASVADRAAMIAAFEARPTSGVDAGLGGYWDAYTDLAKPEIVMAFRKAWGLP